jgi:hypothetical protein
LKGEEEDDEEIRGWNGEGVDLWDENPKVNENLDGMKIPRKRLDPVEMKLSPDCGDAEDDEVDGSR